MTQERFEHLLQAIEGPSSILILPHNDPDTGATASAVALRYLLAEKLGTGSQIACRGIIGGVEDNELVHCLQHPLRRLTGVDLRLSTAIAPVDTQPSAGNNPQNYSGRAGVGSGGVGICFRCAGAGVFILAEPSEATILCDLSVKSGVKAEMVDRRC